MFDPTCTNRCDGGEPAGFLPRPSIAGNNIGYTVDVPINLEKSVEGKYFVGNAGNLAFGRGTAAWARLFNPPDSDVNLYVTVWTASGSADVPFIAQIWFNSRPPGAIRNAAPLSTSNFALYPHIPHSQIHLQYGSSAVGEPVGGFFAYSRYGQGKSTIADDEQGKFIFPPGGSFIVYLLGDGPNAPANTGSIAFGLWQEPICGCETRR